MLAAAEALAKILAVARDCGSEKLPLDECAGRVLREGVAARADDPPFDKSAVDGWCVDAALLAALPGEVPAGGTVLAGDPPPGPLNGIARKVMTGAPLPPDAAAMVMVEDADPPADGRVRLKRAPPPGAAILRRGENHRAGARLLEPGIRLSPAALGAAAHAGAGALRVACRPPLALLPTGDELVAPGTDPGPGRIVNSSAPALRALLAAAGARVSAGAIVRDSREALAAAIEEAPGDPVLTGGVSMGDADHLPAVAAALGFRPLLHTVAIKPGKPLFVAVHASGRTLWGLPGNPVSSLLTARLFLVPWLRARQGMTPPDAWRLTLAAPAKGAGERAHYLPARIERAGGTWRAAPLATRGSADLAAWRAAEGIVVVPAGVAGLAAGETAEFIPMEG